MQLIGLDESGAQSSFIDLLLYNDVVQVVHIERAAHTHTHTHTSNQSITLTYILQFVVYNKN